MRKFAEGIPSQAKDALERLLSKSGPEEYRAAMTDLGHLMATQLQTTLTASDELLLICTNEDADFLARGLLDGLSEAGLRSALACFWNDRVHLGWADDQAPIIRRFVEPIEHVKTFLVLKSIISSSCVVRTNITELVYKYQPEKILVLAPVVLKGSNERLEADFPPEIASRFEYIWFAEDDESKENGEVVPGIGGSVYELLGIGSAAEKNRFTPQLVEERRKALAY